MGKPRLIILVRHAQSEGNKNRSIHQMIPDHRVKLTDEGHKQAEDAGRRLRALLKPDDSLQIFTSPYRRTRETTEGLLKTLTAHSDPQDPSAAPSPFSRNKIKVYEEPRLREQDFGNFQPCSAEMERMWKERADYGHFFYRIPNGESAADAYDRVSGFNESLWRQFGEKDFPSVLVLVTHGLMTRVFLMKWYHWSVEYFEDLRNINHCEFILMKQNQDSGKFLLESTLRTWSELKKQRAAERAEEEAAANQNPSRRNTLSAFLTAPPPPPQPSTEQKSPSIPARKWGGCIDGCNHHHEHYPRREDTEEGKDLKLPPSAKVDKADKNEADDHALASEEPVANPATDGSTDTSPTTKSKRLPIPLHLSRRPPSGAATPHEMPSDEDDNEYFPKQAEDNEPSGRNIMAAAMRRKPERKPTPEDIERWANESGMGRGRHADALGDEPAPEDDFEKAEKEDKGLRGSVY